MPETKLVCYVRSVESDTKVVVRNSISLLKLIYKKFEFPIILCGIFGSLILAVYVFVMYGVPLILPFTPSILAFLQIFTQYRVYLMVMAGIDIALLYYVKDICTTPGACNNEEVTFWQFFISAVSVITLFAGNAIFITLLAPYSIEPARWVGWSYMTAESAGNFVALMVGVFLLRAYIRCEKHDRPVNSAS